MAHVTAARGVAPARRFTLLSTLLSMFAVARQRKQLADLDAHLLRDIGISEQDLSNEISRPLWDVPQNWRV